MKADRIAKLVENETLYFKLGNTRVVRQDDVLKLLRREQAYQRARGRRIITTLHKQMKAASESTANPSAVRTYAASADMCEVILAALNRRTP